METIPDIYKFMHFIIKTEIIIKTIWSFFFQKFEIFELEMKVSMRKNLDFGISKSKDWNIGRPIWAI